MGSKTRSAGRAPHRPAYPAGRVRSALRDDRTNWHREVSHGRCGHRPALRALGPVPQSRRRRSSPGSRSTTIGSSGSRSRSRRNATRARHDRAVRVELTAFSKGPVIRAEAAAEDKMGALDLALDKMAAQMRRAADRRRVHHGRHTPGSVGEALADAADADGRLRRRRGRHRAPGRPDHGDRRRPAGGPREDPRRRPDDPRPGALRDGAGRPRLLPVRRQGERAALRWSTADAATTTASSRSTSRRSRLTRMAAPVATPPVRAMDRLVLARSRTATDGPAVP